ncbi:MAG: hypothetical protein NDJ92_12130 [Thermoanaerobaculia bacterium]|nr:hypothetical protein [Thermoanaerobaculia bacterium]
MRTYRAVGLSCLVLFSFVGVATFDGEERWLSWLFAAFAVFGLYIALGAGSFDLDEREVRHQSVFGKWQMLWEEVVYVEIGVADGTLVLHGGAKRFILSPPSSWPRHVRIEAVRFVQQQVEKRNLPIQYTRSAAYKIMRGTRVESGAV